MANLTVANEILAQLGGNKFLAMTGAKDLMGDDNSLIFGLPRAAKGIKKVRITLTPDDTYTVDFLGKAPRDPVLGVSIGFATKSKVDGVHCDQLRRIFTDATNLHCTLDDAA